MESWRELTEFFAVVAVLLNVWQLVQGIHLRKTFRSKIRDLYSMTPRAIHASDDLVQQTGRLARHVVKRVDASCEDRTDLAETVRVIGVNAGRLQDHVRAEAFTLREFGRQYLKIEMATWKDLYDEFEERKEARGAG